MTKITLFIITILSISTTYAQVGINTDGSAPHSSAILDVKSTLKAFYPPRMTTTEKEAIVGKQVGAVVFDVTLNELSFYNGTVWVGSGSNFSLPFVGSGIDNASAGIFKINETGATVNGIGIVGISTNGTGLYGYTNSYRAVSGQAVIGVAGYFNSSFGTALLTKGALQFGGGGVGTLGIGKFLKSTSVNGDAQWADLTPIAEVKSISNNMIYTENTMTNNNLAVISGVTNSSTTGAGINGTANNTAPTNSNAGVRGINKSQNSFGYGVQGIHEGAGVGGHFSSAKGDGINAFTLDLTNFADHAAIKGTNNSTSSAGTGVHGVHLGLGEGVYGQSIGGSGVYGSSNTGHAGYFQTSEGEVALYARTSNFAATSRGIEAYGKTGVYGDGDKGIHGYSYKNIGVYGESGTGPQGTLVTYGVYGQSIENNNGTGVYGNGKYIGVKGKSGNASNSIGVVGESLNGIAIYGYSQNTNSIAAKFDSPLGYALITYQGNVGIGVSNPAFILDVNDRIRLRANGENSAGLFLNKNDNSDLTSFIGVKTDTETGIFIGGNWRFWVNAAGSGFLNGNLIQTSDKRLKRDFTQLNNSLTDIYKLNGYHFKWKEEARNKDLQTGLIAQEVQKIFPELVQTDEKGFLSVNYIGLIPHLIEAVKELKKENETLKTDKKSVESRLEKIERLLDFSAKK